MKTNLFIFYLCTYALLTSCIQKAATVNHEVTEKRQVYQINFEESLGVEKPLMLSEIADTIEYLQLKTPKGIIITSIRQVIVSDESIFIISRGIPYQFHRDGNFIRQIGKSGKGPGEYFNISGIAFSEKKREISLFDSQYRIFYYREDGTFIRSRKTGTGNIPIAESDTVTWTAKFFPGGREPFLAIAFGEKMDTLCVISNPVSYDNIHRGKNGLLSTFVVGMKGRRFTYERDHLFFFKGDENNDTIWELHLPRPEIHAILNMGKYKLPVQYRADYSQADFEKHAKEYFCVPWIYEDNRYFFYLAQPWTGKFGFPMVFDKQTGEGFAVRNKAAGLTDDLLHGPSFWPSFISGHYYVGAIEAYDLMERLSSTESPYFKRLLSTINENSNQLLVLCKRK